MMELVQEGMDIQTPTWSLQSSQCVNLNSPPTTPPSQPVTHLDPDSSLSPSNRNEDGQIAIHPGSVTSMQWRWWGGIDFEVYYPPAGWESGAEWSRVAGKSSHRYKNDEGICVQGNASPTFPVEYLLLSVRILLDYIIRFILRSCSSSSLIILLSLLIILSFLWSYDY
jgi:hypothetical protein